MDMAKEEGFFTVAEDETMNEKEEEIISIAEENWNNESKREENYQQDWLSSGKPEHFIMFLKQEFKRIPNASNIRGNVSKMEQVLGQWKRLDSYISKALREDYKGIVDVDFVDRARTIIEQNIDNLEDMLYGIQSLKRNRKQMKRRQRHGEDESIIREGGTPEFAGIQVNISAFERAIVGALINGKVSGGKNIEELYIVAKKKYNIDDKQELAIFQILSDFGYPEFKDRLKFGGEDNEGEWQRQYYA